MIATPATCRELSDQEIIRRSLQDMTVFACLYMRYEGRLLRYIHRLAWVAGDDAEDILQESFLKIWRNLHDYDPTLQASSWLYRIVRNQTLSWLRYRHAYGRDQHTALDPNLPAPEADDASQENEHNLRQVLDTLSTQHREVLILKYLEGMDYAAISDILKIPEGTVATRLNRARQAFNRQARDQHIAFVL